MCFLTPSSTSYVMQMMQQNQNLYVVVKDIINIHSKGESLHNVKWRFVHRFAYNVIVYKFNNRNIKISIAISDEDYGAEKNKIEEKRENKR